MVPNSKYIGRQVADLFPRKTDEGLEVQTLVVSPKSINELVDMMLGRVYFHLTLIALAVGVTYLLMGL